MRCDAVFSARAFAIMASLLVGAVLAMLALTSVISMPLDLGVSGVTSISCFDCLGGGASA
eukprot:9495710-Pyramimonas_sp.AAC.1